MSGGSAVPASTIALMPFAERLLPVARALARRPRPPATSRHPWGFTSHNVRLPDGTETVPGETFVSESPVFRATMRTLRLTAPATGANSQPTLVDLGCLEGGLALEFARAGYDVLGIEGRASNIAKCERLRDAFGLPNLRFAHDDVRNLARYGTFDVVFCGGLLYHLDRPVEFLCLLGTVARRVVVIDTHFAPDRWRRGARYLLSRMRTNEGARGRWFTEWGPAMSGERVEALSLSAVGNRRSFWLARNELLRALDEAGFSPVYEQYDCLREEIEKFSRTLFVGVKSYE